MPSYRYRYFVTIYTGSRPNSGTTAHVALTLVGTTSKSQVKKRDNILFCSVFTSVSDNVPSNCYRYFITIYAGSRPNSGTTARVALTLVRTSKIQVHMLQVKKKTMFSFAAFLHPFRTTCRQTATGTLLPATPVADPTLGRRRVS